MNIHEYLPKELLHGYGEAVLNGLCRQDAEGGRGHAGAVIRGKDTSAAKFEAMRSAGIHVAESPIALNGTVVKALKN